MVMVAGPIPALVVCFIFCSLLSSRSAVANTMLVPSRLLAQVVCKRTVTFR